MVIRCEESQTIWRCNDWRKRAHVDRKAAVARAVYTYPGPAGLGRLWTTWHDLRSGLRRCFVYQRTLTRVMAPATGPRVSQRHNILLWRVHGLRPRTRVVFAVVPYIMRGEGVGGGAWHRVKRYHSLTDRVKRIKPETFILLFYCTHEMCRTYLHSGGGGSVLCFLLTLSSPGLPTVVPRRAAQIIILMAFS